MNCSEAGNQWPKSQCPHFIGPEATWDLSGMHRCCSKTEKVSPSHFSPYDWRLSLWEPIINSIYLAAQSSTIHTPNNGNEKPFGNWSFITGQTWKSSLSKEAKFPSFPHNQKGPSAPLSLFFPMSVWRFWEMLVLAQANCWETCNQPLWPTIALNGSHKHKKWLQKNPSVFSSMKPTRLRDLNLPSFVFPLLRS